MSIGPTIEAPDLLDEVVGFRTFALARQSNHDYCLTSPHQTDVKWTTPTMRATCNKPELEEGSAVVLPPGCHPKRHPAPHPGCDCGIYAYYKMNRTNYKTQRGSLYSSMFGTYDASKLPAIVTLSGRLEVHATGVRAEKATIRALGLHKDLSDYERSAVELIAQRWGIPAVDADHLTALASEFGTELPERLRPVEEEKAKATDTSAAPAAPSIGDLWMYGSTPPKRPWWKPAGVLKRWLIEMAVYVPAQTTVLLATSTIWMGLIVPVGYAGYSIGRLVGGKA